MARPKGSKNKTTLQRQRDIEKSGETPLQYMLRLMRDKNQPKEVRMDMAKSAAPYIHPKLAATQISGDPEAPLQHVIEQVIVDPADKG